MWPVPARTAPEGSFSSTVLAAGKNGVGRRALVRPKREFHPCAKQGRGLQRLRAAVGCNLFGSRGLISRPAAGLPLPGVRRMAPAGLATPLTRRFFLAFTPTQKGRKKAA